MLASNTRNRLQWSNPTQCHLHAHLGLVRLFLIHMDWMGLEKIEKKFDLFGIQTHPIPLNPHGLRANRTSPYRW
uniref:Uncharacterized protein n=1 Tax=Zea mays TaxID=4577 RepID=C4J3C2_MAIZE|nr:unknown [Zea mays]